MTTPSLPEIIGYFGAVLSGIYLTGADERSLGVALVGVVAGLVFNTFSIRWLMVPAILVTMVGVGVGYFGVSMTGYWIASFTLSLMFGGALRARGSRGRSLDDGTKDSEQSISKGWTIASYALEAFILLAVILALLSK